MTIIILLIITAAILAAIIIFVQKQKITATNLNAIPPYLQKKPLTETEQKLYHKLTEALPDCIILAQVQLSSIIGIDKKKAGKDFYKWFNPIAQQSVDFLVCLKDFTVVAAVELDDKSHKGKASERRDSKKNQNLESTGIALIRWHAEKMPSIEEIKQAFH